MAIDLSVGGTSRVESTAAALRDLPEGDFTLRALVRLDYDNTYNTILAGMSSWGNNGWWFEVAYRVRKLRLVIEYSGDSINAYGNVVDEDLTGPWHDLCVTYERSTHTVTHYIDGELNKSAAYSPTGSFVPSADTLCRVGRLLPSQYGVRGDVADAAVWSRVLSAGEVASLAAGALRAGHLADGLALWLPLDSPVSGAVGDGDLGVRDLSGHARHAAVYGTVTGEADPPLHWPPQQVLAATNSVHGGYRVYRGTPSRADIDYAGPVGLCDPTQQQVELAGLGHSSGSQTFYALRAVSASGKEDRNRNVVACLHLNAAGQQYGAAPPPPTHVAAEAVAGAKIRLSWRHATAPGETAPDSFRVYGDGGSGTIDFDTPLETVPCAGDGEYEWTTDALTDGARYGFLVRAASADGREDEAADLAAATADGDAPAALDSILIERI